MMILRIKCIDGYRIKPQYDDNIYDGLIMGYVKYIFVTDIIFKTYNGHIKTIRRWNDSIIRLNNRAKIRTGNKYIFAKLLGFQDVE